MSSALQTVNQRQAQLRQKQMARETTVENAPRQIQIRNADVAASRADAVYTAAQVSQGEMNLAYCRMLAPVSGLVSHQRTAAGERYRQLREDRAANALRIRFRETRKDSINSGPGCQWCGKSTSTRYELRP